jgi:biopolymer transport protein ExbB/biopolymer transport protein TolQ
VGLFGTVVGIINAFKGISTEKSTGLGAVAGGISEALVATAIGLGVAIPAVWACSTSKWATRPQSWLTIS